MEKLKRMRERHIGERRELVYSPSSLEVVDGIKRMPMTFGAYGRESNRRILQAPMIMVINHLK